MTQNLQDKIQAIASNDLKNRHSLFQLHFFLIGKEPTIQSKLWRCVRELRTRQETIEALEMEIADNEDKLLLMDAPKKQDITPDQFEQIRERRRERRKIGVRKNINRLQDRLKGVIEECEYLVKAYEELSSIEPLLPYDHMESQKKYWDEKLGQDFNLRLMFGLPVDPELLKTILALNSDAATKKELVSHIKAKSTVSEQLELEAIMKHAEQLGRSGPAVDSLKEKHGS